MLDIEWEIAVLEQQSIGEADTYLLQTSVFFE